ncbi:hypothetical protein ACFLV5_00985 [Chloroflexota bacterium]
MVGTQLDNDMLWVAVLDDGQIEGFRLTNGQTTPVPVAPGQLLSGMPPILKVEGSLANILVPSVDSASVWTHPVILPSSERLAFVDGNGDLIITQDDKISRFSINALPDGRILTDEKSSQSKNNAVSILHVKT